MTSPILIIHDKSDHIVPFKLGRKVCVYMPNTFVDIDEDDIC